MNTGMAAGAPDGVTFHREAAQRAGGARTRTPRLSSAVTLRPGWAVGPALCPPGLALHPRGLRDTFSAPGQQGGEGFS